MSQLARRLSRDGRDVDVILPFEEVVDALGRVEERYIGLQTIDLDSILGTVDRGAHGGLGRQFPPPPPRGRAPGGRLADAPPPGGGVAPVPAYPGGGVSPGPGGPHPRSRRR